MSEGIGREFMKKTRYKFMKPSGQSNDLPPPPLEKEYDKSIPTINLPSPSSISVREMNLRTVIERRESIRKYSFERILSLEELSWLLWCTQGVKEVGHVTLRNVPSAGARHAFETYLLVNNVESLNPGLYRYLALSHQLVTVIEGLKKNDIVEIVEGSFLGSRARISSINHAREEFTVDLLTKSVTIPIVLHANSVKLVQSSIAERLTEACLNQSHVKNSAVTFFWVAIVNRMKYRYGERGYRYLHLDAGHVCQNLYLAAENIDCGVCAIGAFEDEKVNDVLNLDGKEQFVIYLASLGKKR